MQTEWISTLELIAFLKAHHDEEKKCLLYLGSHFYSTHSWLWDTGKHKFNLTHDNPFSRSTSLTEQEVLDWYGNSKWRIVR